MGEAKAIDGTVATRTAARNELGSLHKGLKALQVLNRNKAMTARQLAIEMGLSRTSARRILDTLVSAGLIDKVDCELEYRLAPAAADLSSGLSEEHILSHVAAPLLYDATETIGWMLSLVTVSDGDMVLQVSTQKKAPYAITYFRQGERVPITASKAGRLATAYMVDSERETLIARMSDTERDHINQLLCTPGEAASFRSRGFYHPISHDGRESHLYVPIFMGDRVPACLIMRYLVSAMPYSQIEANYVTVMQDLSARITARAIAEMTGRVPGWLAHAHR